MKYYSYIFEKELKKELHYLEKLGGTNEKYWYSSFVFEKELWKELHYLEKLGGTNEKYSSLIFEKELQ